LRLFTSRDDAAAGEADERVEVVGLEVETDRLAAESARTAPMISCMRSSWVAANTGAGTKWAGSAKRW
jgi:hypothetical protein